MDREWFPNIPTLYSLQSTPYYKATKVSTDKNEIAFLYTYEVVGTWRKYQMIQSIILV